MPRKYKPVELPLKSIDRCDTRGSLPECPKCSANHSTILGRLGLRFVFRCEECKVRFFRARPHTPGALV